MGFFEKVTEGVTLAFIIYRVWTTSGEMSDSIFFNI